MATAAFDQMESQDGENEMEEGELSDDGMDMPETVLQPAQRMGIKMDMPDLLKEIGGADFHTVDAEDVEKISARALRFQTGNAISFQEVSALYQSLQVSQDKRDSVDRLEMIHVWGQENLDLSDLQRYFSDYHPLNVELVDRNTANVIWATAANCARAMLALSKGIGEAGTERVVKHVLDGGEDRSVVTETETGENLVHPEDIGIEIPDGGPWRLGNRLEDEGILLLRFGKKTDVSLDERRANARHVGILSKSKRDELMAEKQKAVQKEMELKKPVDKKNPWGIVAESWAGESRGRVGRDFDDYVDNLDRGLSYGARPARRDWDAPSEIETEGRVPAKGRGSVRDRLDWGNRVEIDSDDQAETFIEEDEEMDWGEKMKKPRMGMVADIVEKKGSAKSRLYGREDARNETIKRKVPNRNYERTEVVEEEMDSTITRRVNVEERVIKTAGRRMTDRFAGGRLAGRVGLGSTDENTGFGPIERRMEGRLGKPERQFGLQNKDGDSDDSLERDNGADLRHTMSRDLVIQVNQSEDEENNYRGRMDGRGNEYEAQGSSRRKDSELRNLIKDKKNKKERAEEKESKDREKRRLLKEKEEQLLREKRRQERYEREREKEEQLRRKEKKKKADKYKSKRYSSDEDSDSTESESDSGSSASSESETDSSDSDSDSSSSDSQEDKKRKKQKDLQRKKSGNSKDRARDRSSRSHKEHPKSGSSKSDKKDSAEELKKAAELRDKLKNYLKKAKEAKENKKK